MRSLGPFFHKITGVLCALLLLVTVSSASKTKRSASKPGTTTHTSSTTHKSSKATRTSSSTRTTSSHGKRKHSASSKGRGRKASKVARGQQAIDSERASEIQAALIREKYLDGEATGVFDQRTKDALVKFQAANGWQTKVLPDSRALIKLGLGPSTNGLLNPESAAMGKTHQMEEEKEIPGGAMTMPRK